MSKAELSACAYYALCNLSEQHAEPEVQKSTGKCSLNSQLTAKVMLMGYLQCLDLQVIL